MRIVLDARHLTQADSGVGSYTLNLAAGASARTTLSRSTENFLRADQYTLRLLWLGDARSISTRNGGGHSAEAMSSAMHGAVLAPAQRYERAPVLSMAS
jgi:hypothetical protein